MEQLRVLLQEFQGKEGWHFQVANENAGGVHLLQAFRGPVLLTLYRDRLRQRLQRLDEHYPELAAKARQAGMRSLGELEIYPDSQRGFRLPLCEGRTMLLDRPLELVFDQRRKRLVQDVVRYISWLIEDNKSYMPAEDIIRYVRRRLKPTVPARTVKARKPHIHREKASGRLGSFGKMKGRYAKTLVGFWSGKINEPDTLNIAIRLLALPLPHYKNEDEAVELIQSYVDELPDHSFSDRLTSGNRAEVSRVIQNTVRQVYAGNDGQPEKEKSTQIIQATVAAWQKRGFDPTDKTTWGKTTSGAFPLAKDFCWKGAEVIKLGMIQNLLHCSLKMASDFVKYFVRLVKAHQGELSVSLVQGLLERFGIRCGHHGKANQFLALLREWDWIRVTVWERWHERDGDGQTRKGRARTYVIGEALLHKFQETGRYGYSFNPSYPGEQREGVSIITSHCSRVHPFERRKLCLDEVETGSEVACTSALLTECDTERNKSSPESWSWSHSEYHRLPAIGFSYAQDKQ